MTPLALIPRNKRALVLAQRLSAQKRRDRNREAQRCINENNRGTHGPATHGVRCAACDEVHARTSARRRA